MAYQYLLFDFDNTLVDFTTTGERAFRQTFRDFDADCNDEIATRYQKINREVWTAFEQREITSERLRVLRFERLFATLKQAPAPAAEFSRCFLENLVRLSTAYAGSRELLQALRERYGIGLITNGLKEVQRPRLELLGWRELFDLVVVSDEIGVAKPHAGFFAYAYERLPSGIAKEDVLVIGDGLHSDIVGGRDFGFATCWISHGRENDTDVRPNITLKTVRELPGVLGE